MCRTPGPPSTAFVASCIWSGVGEVKTSPGQAASSMPRPTKPPCIGSCPEPPPETMPTLPWTGASARTMYGGSKLTRTRSAWAAAIPSSSSRSTVSGLLMSFFMDAAVVSAGVEGIECHSRDDGADERSDDRGPRVAPVGWPLPRDGQYRVRDPWREVAGRVDRIAGRPSEREADAHDEEADVQRHAGVTRRRLVREERLDPEDEDERRDGLGEDVHRVVADCRAGAEDGELQARVLGLGPVREVGEEHEDGADERAEELADEVLRNVAPVDGADDPGSDRDGRVQVGVAELAHGEDRGHDGDAPPEGDDDPAAVLGLRLVQQNPGDDPVAQEDQDRSPDRLCSDDAQADSSPRRGPNGPDRTLRATLIARDQPSQREDELVLSGGTRAALREVARAGAHARRVQVGGRPGRCGQREPTAAIGRSPASGVVRGDDGLPDRAPPGSWASNQAWTRAIVSLRCSPGSARIGGPKRRQIG